MVRKSREMRGSAVGDAIRLRPSTYLGGKEDHSVGTMRLKIRELKYGEAIAANFRGVQSLAKGLGSFVCFFCFVFF